MVDELGGEAVLGRSFRNETDLQAAIREGFPQAVVEAVMHAAGLTLKELAASLDLSPRSLQRRRREGRLARYESDRLYRLARIIALAKHYIGNDEKASRWLKRPDRALGGGVPIELTVDSGLPDSSAGPTRRNPSTEKARTVLAGAGPAHALVSPTQPTIFRWR